MYINMLKISYKFYSSVRQLKINLWNWVKLFVIHPEFFDTITHTYRKKNKQINKRAQNQQDTKPKNYHSHRHLLNLKLLLHLVIQLLNFTGIKMKFKKKFSFSTGNKNEINKMSNSVQCVWCLCKWYWSGSLFAHNFNENVSFFFSRVSKFLTFVYDEMWFLCWTE